MAVYSVIPPAEIAIDEAVKSSTATKFRDNPLAVTQGDPTALAAGEGVAIDYDFGGGSQTAIITDETDVDKVLTPDGANGVQWSAGVSGMILLERKELAAAVSTVTFAGLDGDTEEVYRLIARINKAVGGAAFMSLQANGGAIGPCRTVTDGGAAVNQVTGRFMTTQLNPSYITLDLLIHGRETVQALTHPRTWQGKAAELDANLTTPLQVVDLATLWTGAGNLVSLGITGSVANSFGIGSTLELFKLVQ